MGDDRVCWAQTTRGIVGIRPVEGEGEIAKFDGDFGARRGDRDCIDVDVLDREVPGFYGARCPTIIPGFPSMPPWWPNGSYHPHDKEYHQSNDIDLIYTLWAFVPTFGFV